MRRRWENKTKKQGPVTQQGPGNRKTAQLEWGPSVVGGGRCDLGEGLLFPAGESA